MRGSESTVATMLEVARRAGVSVSTVSHVLNGTRRVSPDTARVVGDAISAVGYIPNTLARALARSTTSTIGVAVSAISNLYFGEIVRGIEAESARHGFMIFLSDTGDEPQRELEVIRALHQRRVDGIALAPSADPDHRALRYLEEHRIPAVLVDRATSRRFDQVAVENRNATRTLVAHLVSHGHSRIGMISGLAGLPTTAERIEGYRDGLAAAGLPFDSTLIASGHSVIAPARDAVERLLALPQPPTAIVTANNMMTIGAVQALRAAGRRIPDDIALAAFDDFEWADCFDPRLTVMAQPCEQMGVRAVALLLRRIKEPGRRCRTLRLAPTFRIRNSCA